MNSKTYFKNCLSVLFLMGLFLVPKSTIAQFTEETITVADKGDLTIPMGKYQVGNAVRIEAQIAGSWAQDGGVYHLIGDWNHRFKVVYRAESSISQRLKFFGYVDPGSQSRMFLFATWDNNSPDEEKTNTVKFRITSAGNFDISNTGDFDKAVELSSVFVVQSRTEKVGIGTKSPVEKLDVNGTIRSKEVKVENTGWPDYVFDEEYSLADLNELEAYIKENKHLPGIPTQKDVEQAGQKLGAIQAKLLEKIEEQTLYLIQLKRDDNEKTQRIQELRKENRQQQLLIDQLLRRVRKLESQN